jgi:hypothetical protein
MHILESELTLRGYRRCGLVCPDPTPLHFVGRRRQGLFKVEITQPVEGKWVTYIHVLENEFKKAGKTENDRSAGRLKESYNSMRKTIDLMNQGLLLHVNETLYHVAPRPARQRSRTNRTSRRNIECRRHCLHGAPLCCGRRGSTSRDRRCSTKRRN